MITFDVKVEDYNAALNIYSDNGKEEVWFISDTKFSLKERDVIGVIPLFYAMKTGESILFERIDQSRLRNFEYLVNWFTIVFKEYGITKPKIIAKEVYQADPSKKNNLVMALSGGVDSMSEFKQYCIENTWLGHRIYNIGRVMTVIFDEKENERNWCSNLKKVIEKRGVMHTTVRTNLRDLFRHKINFELMIQVYLYAVSTLFSNENDGYIETMDFSVIETLFLNVYHHHPFLNHMYSGDDFPNVHGSHLDRVERTKTIISYPDLLSVLQVCHDEVPNCGVCEKCIRTKLIFKMVNKEPPYPNFKNNEIYPEMLHQIEMKKLSWISQIFWYHTIPFHLEKDSQKWKEYIKILKHKQGNSYGKPFKFNWLWRNIFGRVLWQ